MATAHARRELLRLIHGFEVSQALRIAVELGIADMLNDPLTADQLAECAKVDSSALARTLRLLHAVGVFGVDDRGRYTRTSMSELLRTNAPASLAPWTRLLTREYIWSAWAHAPEAVRTGASVFETVHGDTVWAYRAARPDESALFDLAMAGVTQDAVMAIVEAYKFPAAKHIIDVAGGNGTFLSCLLGVQPDLHATLFEQPHVLPHASRRLIEAGIADRCKLMEGDFFSAIPVSGDYYVLKSILHDWDDAAAVAILRNCRRAMTPRARLLIVEQLMVPGDQIAACLDMHMLVVLGGAERTEKEFETLLRDADLNLARVIPTRSNLSILEVHT